MPARTIGGTLVVAAALILAAGTGAAHAGAEAGLAPTLPAGGSVLLPGAAGGPLILGWVAQVWCSLTHGAPCAPSLTTRPAKTSTSSAEAAAPPPVLATPLSYGGGRGDDPAGPWPTR